MEGDAYLLRHGVKKYNTKVQMGISDLVLYRKESGGSWSSVPSSDDWPSVKLSLGSNDVISNTAGSEAAAQ